MGNSRNMQQSTRGTGSYDEAWKKAMDEVDSVRLPGLRVQCPTCESSGTLVSKWISGTPIKPLFVVHSNGRSGFRACQLDRDETKAFRSQIRFSTWDTRKILKLGKPLVLFSGGKDSLCLLEYMLRLAESEGVEITAIHADTTAGFPEVEDYVQKTCENLDVPLITVRPPHDYFELAKRWGIPSFKSRWCCETLKVAPIRRYLRSIEEPVVVFDGIRGAESNIRATYVPVWYHPSFRCTSVERHLAI